MRKEKEVRINDKMYKVFEIRPKDIINVYGKAKEAGEFRKVITNDLLPILSNIPAEEIEDMYPSDLEEAYEALKEVNASFLKRLKGIAQKPEVKKILNELSGKLLGTFGETFVNSFNADMETL